MKEFGKVVREKRKSRGLTLQKVSGISGLTLQYISDIERGRCVGRIASIVKICRALDLSMDDIFLSDDYVNTEHVTGE